MYVYVWLWKCVAVKNRVKSGYKSAALLFVLTSVLAAVISQPFQISVQEQLCSLMICVGAKKLLIQLDYRTYHDALKLMSCLLCFLTSIQDQALLTHAWTQLTESDRWSAYCYIQNINELTESYCDIRLWYLSCLMATGRCGRCSPCMLHWQYTQAARSFTSCPAYYHKRGSVNRCQANHVTYSAPTPVACKPFRSSRLFIPHQPVIPSEKAQASQYCNTMRCCYHLFTAVLVEEAAELWVGITAVAQLSYSWNRPNMSV